ncbi:Gfo/Idh/MocA family protein [Acidipropionibacterium thoenii]|uniref:Gfo/Idh/MocA family protein n=1 Tax=Acidipropionibacterium thoenii TaxID=1751 RepID=UPI00041EDD12|nr:Gfo/Idh/MocA family oxidoreductase [Acidipropionibacterium thoenii]
MTGLRWGILGTGSIAHTFTSDLRTTGREVVAVGSRSADSARDFAGTFGIARAHGSYQELVADPEVDIIYVASPHSHHYEHAKLVLEAGKHALVEKAFTLNAAQAAELRDLAAADGLFLMEAMWTRYLPTMIRIRGLVAGGALGEIRAVTADHTQLITDDPHHRLNDPALGGGALLDLGVYPISFIWDILGAPTSISARARLQEVGTDTEVATVMTHASGAISTSLSSSRGVGSNTAVIIGTRARIEIDPVWYTATTFRLVATDGTVIEDYRTPVDGRGMQYEALAAERYIAEGRLDSELEPIDETVAIMEGLDEIRRQIGVSYPSLEA